MLTTFILLSIFDIYVHSSLVWQIFIFFITLYTLFLVTMLIYVLPVLTTIPFATPRSLKKNSDYNYVNGVQLLKLLSTPLILLYAEHSLWSNFQTLSWFSHVVFGNFQVYSTFMILIFFFTITPLLLTKLNILNFSNSDFTLTLYQFLFWLWLLYLSNNLLTFIFIIEVVSVLITLLITTSTFARVDSNNVFKKNLTSYFNHSLPTTFLTSLLFFFWMSLISSIMLFIFTSLFFLKIPTFEWGSIEIVMTYLLTSGDFKTSANIHFVWTLFIICLLLKCGIFPFYAWKPTFFKGISFFSITFYVYFYFTLLLILFVEILGNLLHELFYSTISSLVMFLTLGTLFFVTTLLNTHYLKTFIAFSSILNTSLILHALFSITFVDVYFVL